MEAYGFQYERDFRSGYVKINLDNLHFHVRFNILEGPHDTAASATKPTLVLVHGYMCSGVSSFVQWFRLLVPHYRVVVFDNCGWGLNTRLT